MKLPLPSFSRLSDKVNISATSFSSFWGKIGSFISFRRTRAAGISGRMEMLGQKSIEFLSEIKSIGSTKTMDEYERGKLSIFNRLNFFQLITGIIVPIVCLVTNVKFSATSFFIASLPAFVSLLVLCLNFYYKHEAGIIVYFVLYPVVTSIVYLNGMNLGVELFFILYGILSVFFLLDISHMLFSVGLSMISYFVLAIVCNKYTFQLQTANIFFYFFNEITAIVFIFYGLFLIKKENNIYQVGILASNQALQEKNLKIQKQKEEIEKIAELLRKQTTELTELNSLKNKLFSVIAHDLKSPMYALRNLFNHVQQYNLPAAEIRKMIPDVVNDINYTTGLMENLLLWAKSQMNASMVKKEPIDIGKMVNDTMKLLHLQAEAKKISFCNDVKESIFVLGDKDMIGLVLRNLLSNAIKFTPEKGRITIRIRDLGARAEILVMDTGIGISPESLEKINQNNYFTTHGTSSESGTGLGLMLCKEFLHKNDGALKISSAPGEGSVFAFTLQRAA